MPHNGVSSAPGSAPVESPTSKKRNDEATPPACQYGYKRSSTEVRKRHLGPIHSLSSPPSSPYFRVGPPAPVSGSISASSPLSEVVLSNVQPPDKGSRHAENFERRAPSVLPSQFSCEYITCYPSF